MDNKLNSFDNIQKALNFGGGQKKLQNYYDQWSDNYNQDVAKEDYCGPDYIASYFELLSKQNNKFFNLDNQTIEIIDSGCGTGMVGVALRSKGYQNIDGFDLSHNMVKKAKQTKAYRTLTGGCDMTQPIKIYPDNRYDAAISCGVFTTGHVPPTAVEEMIRLTKSGGLVVVSTRKSYYETTDFQEVCDHLQAENKVNLVSFIMDGPYLAEEGAHYWAFKVC